MVIQLEDDAFEFIVDDAFKSGGLAALDILDKRVSLWWGPRKMHREIERLRQAIIRSSIKNGE